MTHVKAALWQKVFDLLSGDAELNNLLGGSGGIGGRILTAVGDSTLYPKLVIDPPELNDWSGHDFAGFDGHINIRAWDQAQSNLPMIAITGRVYALLNAIDLGLAGFPTINFRCTMDSTVIEPDNRTRSGLQRYSVKTGGN